MALSFIQYPANGLTDTFNIPFAYLSKTHIQVKVNGVVDNGITFPTDATVKTSTIPGSGVIVEVRRITPNTSRLVDFADGSLLGEGDLDKSSLQTFFVMQEVFDELVNKLGLDSTNKYDAQSKVICNLAAGVLDTDAANVGQVKPYADSAQSSAIAASTSAGNASASASAAATSASNAANSASTANTSAIAAGNSASAASTSASNAATSATNSANSATSANTSATNAANSASSASTSASTATTQAGNASTSATNAANSASAASTSASNASTSASNASASATAAANSAAAASKFFIQAYLRYGDDQTVTLCERAPGSFTINKAVYKTSSGTFSAAVRINTTTVTGLNALAGTSTQTSTNATGANTVVLGDKIDVVFTSSATGENISLMLECTR